MRVDFRRFSRELAEDSVVSIDDLVEMGPLGVRIALYALASVDLDQSNLHPHAKLGPEWLGAPRFAPMPLTVVLEASNGVDISTGTIQWEWRNPDAGPPGAVGSVFLESLGVSINDDSVAGGYVRLRRLPRGSTGAGTLTNFSATPASVDVPKESAPGLLEFEPGDTVQVCVDTMAVGATFSPASVVLNFRAPHRDFGTPTAKKAR